jgi:hypothetical protein
MLNEYVLNKNGWQIDCQSPLEISHENGDVATGQAAWIVHSYLCQQYEDEGFEEYEDEREAEEQEWEPSDLDTLDEDLD